MKRNLKSDEKNEVRVELKYCERCGGLWVRERGTGVVYCEKCQPEVADLPIPKKKPQRLVLPVRSHTEVEEYEVEVGESQEKDLEAAGGAA